MQARDQESENQLVLLTADIVAAHLTNNIVAVGDVGDLIQRVHGALSDLGRPVQEEPAAKQPVVSIRASVKPDYLVCMECGRKQKTLRRHLQSAHGMTADQYRQDYGLPQDYPLVAPDYSSRRSEMAKAIGLGRKRDGDAGKGNAAGRKRAPATRTTKAAADGQEG